MSSGSVIRDACSIVEAEDEMRMAAQGVEQWSLSPTLKGVTTI
ncbi:MAG TPA: hypothetical protein VGV87_13850 [Blastocatellia bacterium]|nr:hypothetical protein [Blastocatellia bacterium]